MTLGENIVRLRTQKNWSQGDLADALDISRQSVSKWETDASIPELDKLLKLSELFGVTLDELVRGEDAPKAETAAPAAQAVPASFTPQTSSEQEKRHLVFFIQPALTITGWYPYAINACSSIPSSASSRSFNSTGAVPCPIPRSFNSSFAF